MKYKLSDLLETISDYHANGSYKHLKKNVSLKDKEDYALMIRTTNFEKNDFSQSLKFISKDAYDFLKKSKVHANDILMNKIATPGSVYLMPNLDRPVSLGMNLFLLRVDEKKANPIYVFIYLKINEKYIKSFAQGSVTQTITKHAVKELILELPERKLQDAIVEIYENLSTKIELNKKTNETLEEIAKALFKSWFIDFDPIRAKAEGRSTGLPDEISNLFPDSFEDSELGEIPKSWSIGEIQDLCAWVSSGGTPARSNKEYWNNGNISWFKTGELKDSLLFDSLENINELAIQNSSCKLWGKGTILFAIYASPTVGRLGVLTKDGTCNQAAAGLKAKEEIGTAFLRRCLLFSRKKLQNIAVGAAQQNINVKILKEHQIIIPNNKLCLLYTNLVGSIDSKEEVLMKETLYLEKLRNALLPKLISGELRIPDAEKTIEEVEV